MSVLMHSVLVQVLAGNATLSKTPSDGGLYSLTVAHALARRAGLPVSLVSGSGGQLSDALVRNEHIDALAFVGGKTNGGVIASTLYDEKKRYMFEMEGVNTYGIFQLADSFGAAPQRLRLRQAALHCLRSIHRAARTVSPISRNVSSGIAVTAVRKPDACRVSRRRTPQTRFWTAD